MLIEIISNYSLYDKCSPNQFKGYFSGTPDDGNISLYLHSGIGNQGLEVHSVDNLSAVKRIIVLKIWLV